MNKEETIIIKNESNFRYDNFAIFKNFSFLCIKRCIINSWNFSLNKKPLEEDRRKYYPSSVTDRMKFLFSGNSILIYKKRVL